MRTPAINVRSSLPAAAALLLAVAGACSGLRMEYPPRPDGGDWPMGGRTPQRTAEAAEELAPPLEAVWTADVTGGFGQGGVAVVDSTVFAVNLRGELYGIDLVTGKRLGWVDLGEAYEGAPAVNGGRVFLASSAMTESFHSYDLASGKREWRVSVGESETSPLLYRGRLYAATLSGSLVCLDPAAGAELWRFELPDNRRLKGIRSNPAADSGLVVFGADDGGVYCLDAVSGKLRWRVETGTAVTAPVAVSGGRVFAAGLDGFVRSVELLTGKVAWARDLGCPLRAGPAVRRDIVVLGTSDRRLVGLDPAGGRTLWSRALEGGVSGTPVLSGAAVYAGTLAKKLYAVSADSGAVLWIADTPGRVKSALVIHGGTLLVPTDQQYLVAFRRRP